MIKVLYFSAINSYDGGAPRSLVELINSIDRSIVEPYFCSPYASGVIEKIIGTGTPMILINEPIIGTPPFFSINSILPLVHFIKKNRIDIIHNNQVNDALFTMIPAKITHTPLIIHHRDPTFLKSHRILTSLADANIAISTWQNEKNLSGKGVVIHNGISLENFEPGKPIMEREFVNSDRVFRVGLLGRIMKHKAQDIFVQSANLVLKKIKNVEFFIAGDDHEKSSADFIAHVKKMVFEMGLEGKVFFTGHSASPAEFYRSMDLIIVPSRKEPFGRVMIEAMACEKPVIATNVWGALDIVTPETGILVNPEDPNSLAEAILSLIQDPVKIEWMGKNGRDRVKANFTIERTLSKIYTLYEGLLH